MSNLVGKRFGRLTVVERVGSKKGEGYSRALWRCSCDCGGEKVLNTRDLTSGHTRSCGCLAKESRKLGLWKIYADNETIKKHNALRAIWKGVVRRCFNPRQEEYERYGGRGITVCENWRENSKEFIKWGLDNGFELGLSIDRIDNDGDYEPSNCTFISRSENAKKKESSQYLTANGLTMTLCEWSRYINRNIGYLGYWKRKYGVDKAREVLINNLNTMNYAR